MKKFVQRVINLVLGINFSAGFVLGLWVIVSLLAKKPEFSAENVRFLFLSMMIPWLLNFIFDHSSSYLYVKGILHGVVWFVLEIIIYNLMFGANTYLDAKTLIVSILIFSAIYAGGLVLFSKITAKLNIPVRRFTEFCAKVFALLK